MNGHLTRPNGRGQPPVRPLRQDSELLAQKEDVDVLWEKAAKTMARLDEVYLGAQLYLDRQDHALCHDLLWGARSVGTGPGCGSPISSGDGVGVPARERCPAGAWLSG